LYSTSALAQNLVTPPTFRLVMPHGPGSILIDTTGDWKLDIFKLVDNGKRPILQMHNEAQGIIVSYIIDNAPGYYDTSEACKNDVLGGIMQGPLAKASVKNKQNSSRTLANGQTLAIGSYFVAKNENLTTQEQVVFGFVAFNHTCGWIHLSRQPSKPGEEHLFDAALDAFTYDPNYVPTPADYAVMASLLPPGMAAAYNTRAAPAAASAASVVAPHTTHQSLDFALARHPGYLHMDAPSFEITELSAKSNGNEFGIRAKDKLAGLEALSFLFLPEPAQPTAVACRDWMMKSENGQHIAYRKITGQREMKSDSGVDIAIVEYEQSKTPAPFRYIRRAFVAANDLCADIQFSYSQTMFGALSDPLLATLTFDPNHQPDFFEKFRFATILYDHHAYAAAAPVYESALDLVTGVQDATTWRRVTADQASMAYGMSGDLKHSRAINETAIAKDPDYPLYYYNLACADAEAGDAIAARTHLQQAFDRRANTIKGETLPEPSKDDSILKLKNDKAFWAFVQSLPQK
jgi:tetratricopeptide (TPR) repeat protein